MAEYDGSIRINTSINTENAKIQLHSLENSISKTAEKIASLRSKLDIAKNIKLPTQEYQEIQSEIDKTEKKLNDLTASQERFLETGGAKKSSTYQRMSYDIEQLRNSLSYLKGEAQDLEDTGKAFTIGNPEDATKLEQQLHNEEAILESMTQKRDILTSKIQAQAEEEERLAQIKENATVTDQDLVKLLERRKELLKEIADMTKAGVTEGYQEYDTAVSDLADVQEQINGIIDMRDEVSEAKASYKGLGDVVRETGKTIARGFVDIPIAAVKAGVNGLVSAFKRLGSVAKDVAVRSFRMLGTSIKGALSKAGSLIGSMVSKLKSMGKTARKSFSALNDSAKKSNNTLKMSLKNILKYGFGIRSLFVLVNKFRSAVKEGFGNLYEDNEKFKNSVDELKTSILTLKNALAAAFRPLVDIAIPYIQMASDKLTELLDKVGQFLAAVAGQKTYTKAIRQTADAFKDAKKAAEGYLSPLDEINKFSTKKDDEEVETGVTFEEVPISQKFKDMAEKAKEILSDIFAPIKEAWNREGQFVIDSWKYGLNEIAKLAKDIGRDFLKVWKQPVTVAMLSDILHIVGDIGLVAGNLASKFRDAWNTNNVGLHILENIRDIFAVIIHNIREAADYTVEWSKKLDFKPLLNSIERLTASLIPFADYVSGTLADFYTEFILPLASWSLSENGIPRLLNIMSEFMERVDWVGIREALKNLYSALEPYAEAIGTGLIDFIDKLKEGYIDFLNSLPASLNTIADSLRSGNVAAAFEEFGRITGEAVKLALNSIKLTIESINWGEIGTLIASFINGIDWKGVGDSLFVAFTSTINAAIDLVYNFIVTTDWRSLGEALGKSLSDALVSIDWAKAGQAVGEAFKAFFNFIAESIENIDWQSVGEKVKEFIVNIDWAGVADAFFEALGASVGGLASFLIGLIGEAWKSVVDWWHDVAYKDGEFTMQGLLDGILEKLKSIGAWIKEHVFDPFMDGFRKAFQIHSPSKAMETIGQYIIEGLLNGIKNMWSSITSWIEDKVNWIIDKFKGVKDKVSGFFSGGGGSSSSSSNGNYSLRSYGSVYASNPAFASLQNIEFPAYATGQVIPRTMKQHLAILGDNSRETEVVSPLSTMKEAMKEAIMEMGGIGNDRPIIAKLYLDGVQVYESVINQGKINQMSSGNNDFLLGTT